MVKVFKANGRPSAFELRKEHGYHFPGGVLDTANRLAKKQNEGWTGSKSLHSTEEGRKKKRIKLLKKREKQAA